MTIQSEGARDAPITEEMVAGSARLYLVFGGIAAGMHMPPFEFYNASRILTESKIFFRDLSQTWYQNGLPGISRDVFGTADFLRGRIRESGATDIVFVGNSMGGFAALLFASLLGRGRVIAFAPQTFITPMRRLRHRDGRWRRQIVRTWATSAFKPHVWDVRDRVAAARGDLQADLLVSTDDALDHIHAARLAHLPGITLRTFDVGGHGLVRHLRDEGLLPDILRGQP